MSRKMTGIKAVPRDNRFYSACIIADGALTILVPRTSRNTDPSASHAGSGLDACCLICLPSSSTVPTTFSPSICGQQKHYVSSVRCQ